ncbi:hypothetical protein [Burkholderia cenocepacia]|uniref:hypothetical protein n=2 Tax=Burkholderia cenocepacia TaxID=95486 RepID=UPI001177CB59|nr:hypothetical protein [Burkholderia cenocepacia]MBR8075044.1 hypothetical protein [Burkholderia cenocepacia]
MYTPHFYQARLMNLFSACAEMMRSIEELRQNEKNSAYVAVSMKEIEQCWDSDPVAQELFYEFAGLKSSLGKSVKNGDLSPAMQQRICVFCRAILSRQEDYAGALVTTLENAVSGAVNIAQKERITSQIDRLTGLYVTYLLNQGYSPTYLYNRVDIFTRIVNYSGRNFSEQFRMTTEKLRNQKVEFDIYYGIHTNKPSVLLSIFDDPDFTFLDAIPAEIGGADLEKFKRNIEITVVAKTRSKTTDYVSAALRAKEKLDKLLDAATALELNANVRVSAHSVVIFQNQNSTYRHTLNVDRLLAFMSSEVGSSFSQQHPSIIQAFKGLNEEAMDQLGRSLRYLRLARHSSSFEQKLLNLWIALESLFSESDVGILQNILEYVPSLYAVAGLRRRIAYLRDLLVANEISAEFLAGSVLPENTVKFDGSAADHHIFQLLRNEDLAIRLFDSLGDKEHLKFKLMQIHGELKDNAAIADRLERSHGDVARQLRRIYFLRNKMAHTGHYKGVRPQLITHLLDYIAVCYRAISAAAINAKEGATYSIGELLTAARMGSDLVVARVSVKDPVLTLDHISPNPLI